MLHKTFGHTTFSVSALGFGAGHLGDDVLTDQEAHHLLERALALGITFFDTARSYGRSEERLGAFLPPHRDDVVLSTKVGTGVPGQPDWSAAAVRLAVEESLRTLRTDVIDVVFLHSCPLAILEKGKPSTRCWPALMPARYAWLATAATTRPSPGLLLPTPSAPCRHR
ncbi:aldo/keto reductase [Arthrobacter sp. SA17]